MDSKIIKSGFEVVREFLDSLRGDKTIDADTLAAVHDLFETGKLSRTRLLVALEALRVSAIAQRNSTPSEGDVPGDD
jgi:hypothetical protein